MTYNIEYLNSIKGVKSKRIIWCGASLLTLRLDDKIWYDGKRRVISEILENAGVFPAILKWQNPSGEKRYAKIEKADTKTAAVNNGKLQRNRKETKG